MNKEIGTIEHDMILHRKLCLIINEGLRYCEHDLSSHRAYYFNLHKLIRQRDALYIKLLIQVPDYINTQIKLLNENRTN